MTEACPMFLSSITVSQFVRSVLQGFLAMKWLPTGRPHRERSLPAVPYGTLTLQKYHAHFLSHLRIRLAAIHTWPVTQRAVHRDDSSESFVPSCARSAWFSGCGGGRTRWGSSLPWLLWWSEWSVEWWDGGMVGRLPPGPLKPIRCSRGLY